MLEIGAAPLLVDDDAVRVHDAVGRDGREGRGLDEVEGRDEFAVDGTGEVDARSMLAVHS